jgi:hypothetical protein
MMFHQLSTISYQGPGGAPPPGTFGFFYVAEMIRRDSTSSQYSSTLNS